MSETSTAVPSTLPSPSQKLISLPDTVISTTSTTPSDWTDFRLRRRGKAPKLTKAEVDSLAAKFSDVLPEREFSMASLQGYLMTYKTRPLEAVSDFPSWIEKERRERREAKEKETQKKERERLEKEKDKENKEREEKEKKEKEEKEKKEKAEKGMVKQAIQQASANGTEGSKDSSVGTTASEVETTAPVCSKCSSNL